MRTDDDIGIDRDAWRRRLGGVGAPSENVDLAIRAEARRVYKPRTSFWWLPTSLAAALVIAVVLAQWQVEDERLHPLVDESQILRVSPTAATAPAAPDDDYAGAAPGDSAYATPPDAAAPAAEMGVPAPQLELPSLDEARERAAEPEPSGKVDNAAPPPPAAAPADESAEAVTSNAAPSATATRQESQQRSLGKLASPRTGSEGERTPEQWYAEIERLRAAGRDAEADVQLELFEETYPGWLEEHDLSPP